MSYLSQPPRYRGAQVVFADRTFRFPSPREARQAAARLKEANDSGSLWTLVDLLGGLEGAPARPRRRVPEFLN